MKSTFSVLIVYGRATGNARVSLSAHKRKKKTKKCALDTCGTLPAHQIEKDDWAVKAKTKPLKNTRVREV